MALDGRVISAERWGRREKGIGFVVKNPMCGQVAGEAPKRK